MTFNATCIRSGAEDGVALLGFADDETNTKQYFLVSRTLAPDDQDESLGLDRTYFELNDQKNSAYGSVEEVQVDRTKVLFRLDETTSRQVSGGQPVEITFDVTSSKLAEIVKQLCLLVGREKVLCSVAAST